MSKDNLELERLRRTFDLATLGMQLSKSKFPFLIIAILLFCMLSGALQWLTGKGLIDGTQLVIVVCVIAAALLAFYAFVFGRMLTLKANLSKARKSFEIDVKGNSEDHRPGK